MSSNEVERVIVPIGLAACRRLESLAALVPKRLRVEAPHTGLEPRVDIAAPARSASASAGSRTRFLRGGDHFMTTSPS